MRTSTENSRIAKKIQTSTIKITKTRLSEIAGDFSQKSLSDFRKNVKEKGLEYINSMEGDPVAEWILTAGPKRRLAIFSIILFMGFLAPGFSILEEDFFIKDSFPRAAGESLEALEDLGYWNQYFLIFIVLTLVLMTYFPQLEKTLLTLAASNAFDASDDSWNQFCTHANRMYSAKIPWFLAYVAGGITMAANIIIWMIFTENCWYTLPIVRDSDSWVGLFAIPAYFFCYYLMGVVIFRVVITYFVLRDFFSWFRANIQPLHPDECGGLKSLGDLSMKLNIAIFFFGIVTAIGLYTNLVIYDKNWDEPTVFGQVVAYLIASGVIFFLPLYAAHSHMRRAKHIASEAINDRFTRLNREFLLRLETNDPIDSAAIDDMESLKKVHDLIGSMPVLPFNLKLVSSFLISVIAAPLTIYLLKIFVGDFLLDILT